MSEEASSTAKDRGKNIWELGRKRKVLSEKISPFPIDESTNTNTRWSTELKEAIKEWRVETKRQLPDELDRLAENLHDFLVKELGLPLKPYAKLLQPVIWKWAEKGILGALGGDERFLLGTAIAWVLLFFLILFINKKVEEKQKHE